MLKQLSNYMSKKGFVRLVLALFIFSCMGEGAYAQKKSSKRTNKGKTKTAAQAKTTPEPAPDTTAVVKVEEKSKSVASDTLPIPIVKRSMRQDDAVDGITMAERAPLEYENLRYDDAVFRQKLTRELDCREKMNAPFMYKADEDNGNQRFISILMSAVQDTVNGVTAFSDARFTTPMKLSEVAKMIAGEEIEVPKYDSLGQVVGTEKKRNEVSLDSFYRYLIKEEVIFDKESSRLFWRIIGIAPVKDVITASGINLGPSPLFWLYYPDLRPVLSKYEVYNSKNVSGRMTWDDLFQGRMFSARIIKTSQENPKDLEISKYPGLTDKPLLQLFEGENIKERIFNYEQDQWSY